MLNTLLVTTWLWPVAVVAKKGEDKAWLAPFAQHTCSGYDEEWTQCPDLPECKDNVHKAVDCKFGDWGDWYDEGFCSGLVYRQRNIAQSHADGGLPCEGNKVESKEFISERCKVDKQDCELSEWSKWSKCKSATDQKYATREVKTQPKLGGASCKGPLKKTAPCGDGPLRTDCSLQDWQDWSECSTSCGEGRRSRIRDVAPARHGGSPCKGVTHMTQKCKVKDCKERDCKFAEWSDWEASEDGMQLVRDREVEQKALGEGEPCKGVRMETKGVRRTTEPVDCEVGGWSKWTKCDKECDGGQTTRSRSIKVEAKNGGRPCKGMELAETKACNENPCDKPVDCKLADWSEWGKCSATCGTGSQERTRKIKRSAKNGGEGCKGALTELQDCKVAGSNGSGKKTGGNKTDSEVGSCPTVVDCAWSDWYEWSDCSCPCGGGTKTRSRAIKQAPSAGGQPCKSKVKHEIKPCNKQSCDKTGCVDGKWGKWMGWSKCSASCGMAYRSRRRAVEEEPDSCGEPLKGLREQFEKCDDLKPCIEDKDCKVSPWGNWSTCSCTCFGVRERNRFIIQSSSGKGNACNNLALKDIEPCNPGKDGKIPEDCDDDQPADCKLSRWSGWSECTRTCGGGQKRKSRKIIQEGKNGGLPCKGNLLKVTECNMQPCKNITKKEKDHSVDCQWGKWTDWSDCTNCQGSKGQKMRTREIETLPQGQGSWCHTKGAQEVTDCKGKCQDKKIFCAWSDWSSEESICKKETKVAGATALRTRFMVQHSSKKGLDDVFFSTRDDGQCSGSQATLEFCDGTKTGNEGCVPKGCSFGEWGDWSAPTCPGLCERTRSIEEPNNECGEPCDGRLTETKRCHSSCDRAQDCILGEWGQWSDCFDGQRERSRLVLKPSSNFGEPCKGDLSEVAGCGPRPRSKPCKFSDWQAWSKCSISCGGGWRVRKRTIARKAEEGGKPCQGHLSELDDCAKEPCPVITEHGKFTGWTDWTECSDDSLRQRTRKATVTRGPGQGKPVEGGLIETKSCGRGGDVVDCKVGRWSPWGTCDRTCGGGQRSRRRDIEASPRNGGQPCPEVLAETGGCNDDPCEVDDCQVGLWSAWGSCSATCGVGQTIRVREIVRRRAEGGAGCAKDLEETKECNNDPCHKKVDCVWGVWEDWSGCSCECDGGQRSRMRQIKVAPRGGGQYCKPQDKEQIEPCNTKSCSEFECVDGKFAQWEDWSKCSASCDGGTKTRKRSMAQTANACGTPAKGKDREVKFCNQKVPCKDDRACNFTEWSDWSYCDCACHGNTHRTRKIDTYGTGNGKSCVGGLKELAPCNPRLGDPVPKECKIGPNPIDCKLGDWSKWSRCSADCAHGEQTRLRVIVKDAKNGGQPCKGALKEAKQCYAGKCSKVDPQDCVLGDWKEWEICGQYDGERKRWREILTYPENGGGQCPEAALQEINICPKKVLEEELTYCIWGTWESWGKCSSSCGKGRRSRRKYLSLSNKAGTSVDVEKKVKLYSEELARLEMVENRPRLAYLGGAFVLGGMCVLLVLGVLRAMPSRQRRHERLINVDGEEEPLRREAVPPMNSVPQPRTTYVELPLLDVASREAAEDVL